MFRKIEVLTFRHLVFLLQGKDGSKGEPGPPGLPGKQVLVTPEVRIFTCNVWLFKGKADFLFGISFQSRAVIIIIILARLCLCWWLGRTLTRSTWTCLAAWIHRFLHWFILRVPPLMTFDKRFQSQWVLQELLWVWCWHTACLCIFTGYLLNGTVYVSPAWHLSPHSAMTAGVWCHTLWVHASVPVSSVSVFRVHREWR